MTIFKTWQIFRRTAQWACTYLSFLLNIILISLIVYKSPRGIGTYRYLMIYISIFELVYSLWDLLAEVQNYNFESGFIVFRDMNGSMFSRKAGFLLVVVYCALFGFSMAIFGIHFIYRYGAINREFFNRYLSHRKIYILFSIPMIYALWWGLVCYYFFDMNLRSEEYMRLSMLSEYNLNIENTSYVCVIFKTRGDQFDIKVLIGMICCWFITISSMWTVFYFGIKCYFKIRKTFKNTSNMSKNTKSLQQQLFQALVAQTFIPLILMYIPITILFLFPMIGYDIGQLSSFVTSTISIYPAIDPIPNMLIIKSYRNTVLYFFCSMFRFSTRFTTRVDIVVTNSLT